MAKYCSNCGNKVDEKAVICVKCGYSVNQNKEVNDKNKNNNKIPAWAIVLIIIGCLIIILPILLLIILGTIIDNIDVEDKIKDYYHEIEDEYTDEKNIEELYGNIGDTINTENYTITLTKVNKYDNIEEYNDFDNEDNSKEYVVYFFEIKNNSNYTQYISTFNFKGYLDDHKIDNLYTFNKIDGYNIISGNIASGKTIEGYIAYKVDREWDELEVHFTDNSNYLKQKEVIFYVENNELEQDKDL